MRLHDAAAFRELVFPEELPMDADAVGEAEGDGPATCDRPPSDQDSPSKELEGRRWPMSRGVVA
jgi:hypothetical protein